MKMVKKVMICMALVCIAVCSGCSKNVDEKTQSKDKTADGGIRKIIVTYEEDVDTQIEYSIDVENNKRTISTIGKTLTEKEDDYSNSDKLVEFVEKNVVTSDFAEDKKDEQSDDEKVLWSVKISYNSGEDMFVQKGYVKYPDYWDDLIQLIKL